MDRARTDPLRAAAARAGLDEVELLEEPVAAARHYAAARVAEGGYVAVYDLGGGTFDTAVLQRTGDGFLLAGKGGDQELGGEDFDERLARHVASLVEEIDPELWARTIAGAELEDRRRFAAFHQEVRTAKEVLSDSTVYNVVIPNLAHDVQVTRAELEDLLRDDLRTTVAILQSTVHDAGIDESGLAAVYMTGGSSRIPLAETLVFETFGRRPTTYGDPKGVVALGAARSASIDPEPGAAGRGTASEPGPVDEALAAAEEQLRERRARPRGPRQPRGRARGPTPRRHRSRSPGGRRGAAGPAHRDGGRAPGRGGAARGELTELQTAHRAQEQAGRAELESTRPHDLEAVWIRLEDGLVRLDWNAADAASVEIVQRYAGGPVSTHARAAKVPDDVLTTLDERWQEVGGSRLRDRRWVWSSADGVTTVPITSRFSSKSSAETALPRRLPRDRALTGTTARCAPVMPACPAARRAASRIRSQSHRPRRVRARHRRSRSSRCCRRPTRSRGRRSRPARRPRSAYPGR